MKRALVICCLIVFDLFVKIVVFNNFMGNKVKVMNDKIGFVPYHNTEQLSIFNNELDLGLSIFLLIIINLAIIICLPIGYRYILKYEYTNKYFELTYIFILSGTVCSFIDKVLLVPCFARKIKRVCYQKS